MIYRVSARRNLRQSAMLQVQAVKEVHPMGHPRVCFSTGHNQRAITSDQACLFTSMGYCKQPSLTEPLADFWSSTRQMAAGMLKWVACSRRSAQSTSSSQHRKQRQALQVQRRRQRWVLLVGLLLQCPQGHQGGSDAEAVEFSLAVVGVVLVLVLLVVVVLLLLLLLVTDTR